MTGDQVAEVDVPSSKYRSLLRFPFNVAYARIGRYAKTIQYRGHCLAREPCADRGGNGTTRITVKLVPRQRCARCASPP